MQDNKLFKWMDEKLEQLVHDVRDIHIHDVMCSNIRGECLEKINDLKEELGGERIDVL